MHDAGDGIDEWAEDAGGAQDDFRAAAGHGVAGESQEAEAGLLQSQLQEEEDFVFDCRSMI